MKSIMLGQLATKEKYVFIYQTIITLFACIVLILLNPVDFFSHGYFVDETIYQNITTNDIIGNIDLETQNYECTFIPISRHFAGFEINLANHPEGNTGHLYLNVKDDTGKILDKMKVDLSKVTEGNWYKVIANKELKKDKEYTLEISAQSCENYPYLQIISPDILSQNEVEGDLLIRCAYAHSTFTKDEKILITMYIVAAWMLLFSIKIKRKHIRLILKNAAVFTFLIAVLSWNFMYNFMDIQNIQFENFQVDSETLVAGPIYADYNSVTDTLNGYGLGRYSDGKGDLYGYNATWLTDDNWTDGYSNYQAAIVLKNGKYTENVAKEGDYILFANGNKLMITDVIKGDWYTNIYLDSSDVLTKSRYGSLDNIVFVSKDGQMHDKGIFMKPYSSQYGLQGKVFRYIARHLNPLNAITELNLLCSLISAIVFLSLVLLLRKKYNNLLAACFFITFWISPWLVNFARNLYWVEFTWFLPMIFGLLCSYKINNGKIRIICYIGTFVSILIKSLCGYEYISTIMTGTIAYLLIDFIVALCNRNIKQALQVFRVVILVGISALAGFCVAMCMHAEIRGGGDILTGIKYIVEGDLLRRTRGADLNYFNNLDLYALMASSWETISIYFNFSTELITGLSGNLFPVICIAPLIIFAYEINLKKYHYEEWAMYIVFFMATISWFVLAKQHSYIHTHMNYVLWYTGFIQICFYIIVKTMVFKKFRKE